MNTDTFSDYHDPEAFCSMLKVVPIRRPARERQRRLQHCHKKIDTLDTTAST